MPLESLIRLEILEKPPKLTPGSWRGVTEAEVLSVTARAEISRDCNNRNTWRVSGAHKEPCKLSKEFPCYPQCCRKFQKGLCKSIRESKWSDLHFLKNAQPGPCFPPVWLNGDFVDKITRCYVRNSCTHVCFILITGFSENLGKGKKNCILDQ